MWGGGGEAVDRGGEGPPRPAAPAPTPTGRYRCSCGPRPLRRRPDRPRWAVREPMALRVQQWLDPAVAVGDPHNTTTPSPLRVRSRSAAARVCAETVDSAQNSSNAIGWSSATVSSSNRRRRCASFRRASGTLPSSNVSRPTHTQQIHHPGEPVLFSGRKLDHQRGRVQPLPYRRDRRVEVGTSAVQLVDEGDPRHPVPIGLPPQRLALRFDSRDSIEHRDRAIEHP